MINTTLFSSISLSFNDSWLAHIGSRIYRTVIEAVEFLGTAFSYPLIQPYSGKRLYHLVDTYREGVNNKELYNRARSRYTDSIITALQGEKNIFEKTKRIRTILNTHIIGLSILQAKDKKALSEHVAYTLFPSLIDEFGAQMANRSILALHELDDTAQSKSNHTYAKLYRDITLQQSDLNSFVQALQGLNSNVSKDILIHELLLSRNRNLTKAAKNKIIITLAGDHYIDVTLQRKLQLLNQIKSQTQGKESNKNEMEADRDLMESDRDFQIDAINYMGPSIFFPSPSSRQITTISEEMPVGIVNTDLNCWYNSALQIMSNTPIYNDIVRQEDTLSKDFPTISTSLHSYRDTYRDQSNIRRLSQLPSHGEIVRSIRENQDLRIDNARIPVVKEKEISSSTNKHLLLDKIAKQQVNVQDLLINGTVLHTQEYNDHYSAVIKLRDSWYLCEVFKNKIITTLVDDRYIDVKLQRKLELLNQIKSQTQGKESNKNAMEADRDFQIAAIDYMDPQITTTSEEMPVGIVNIDLNCWYNSALQIMNNTPIYNDIVRQEDKLSKDFPTISASLNSYQDQSNIRSLRENQDLRNDKDLFTKVLSYRDSGKFAPLHFSRNQMQKIRTEAHNSLSNEFETGVVGEGADSMYFLHRLLEELSIDVARIPISEKKEISDATNKHLLLDKIAGQPVDLQDLFANKYQVHGVIFHIGSDSSCAHYFAAVKVQDSWYLCNDALVEKISTDGLQEKLQKNRALIVASRIEEDLAAQVSEPQTDQNTDRD